MINISRRYQLKAHAVANRLPHVFNQRGLEVPFSEFLLTETQGIVLLFVALDVSKIKRLESYIAPELLHHVSTDLQGIPVLLSNSNGLRYAIPLSPLPRLPHKVSFPGLERGKALLGIRSSGEVLQVDWSRLGHLLVAGKTGSGKSMFLRLIVHQALSEGMQLLLSDLDGTTFSMFTEYPHLLAPVAFTPANTSEIVSRALGECDHRATLYSQVVGFPETLDEYNRLAVRRKLGPLPRLVIVLDEFSSVITSLGGPRSNFANQVAELGWRGRKFGIHLIFAAQDFTKQIVGRVRDQVSAAICFRVRGQEAARAVGCPQAIRIPENRPGLAYTDRWGPIQTFYLDKQVLIADHPKSPLTDYEIRLAQHAIDKADGRMSIPNLVSWGLPERQARSIVEDWELRGWLQQDPFRHNARYITPKLHQILSNCQTSQTASNPSN